MQPKHTLFALASALAVATLLAGCFGVAPSPSPTPVPTPTPTPSPSPTSSELAVGDCVDTDASAGTLLVKRFVKADCASPAARYRIVGITIGALQSCPDTAELTVDVLARTYCLSTDVAGLETPKLPMVAVGDCLDIDQLGTIVNSFHVVDCNDATADARVVKVIPYFGLVGNGDCPAEADTWIDIGAQTISGEGRRICIANV